MNGEQLQTLENGRPKPILWIRMATRPFMTSFPGILGHSPWPIRGMRCSDFPRHNNNFITALRAKTQAHWALLSFLDVCQFLLTKLRTKRPTQYMRWVISGMP